MNLEQIKAAVEAGKTVHVGTGAYIVVKDVFKSGNVQWLIKCTLNNYCIGLTHADGVTLNDSEDRFFIGRSMVQNAAIGHITDMLKAMNNLSQLWDNHKDEMDETLIELYPFAASLDEQVIAVAMWLDSAKHI